MACDYNITGNIKQDCVPTACGYNSSFFITTWDEYNAGIKSAAVAVATSADFMAHTVKFKTPASGDSYKPLRSFDDMRTAVFSGSTKAKADSPLSIPYFTKSLQLGVDKNAYMAGSDIKNAGDEIAAAAKLINVLSAGRFVVIAERTDGKGFEAFGALSPLKCTAIDQSLAADDSNNGMVTVTLECTEGDFATAVSNTATELAAYVKAE